jgi:hypothetical protein
MLFTCYGLNDTQQVNKNIVYTKINKYIQLKKSEQKSLKMFNLSKN